ncbi:MAG: LPXTG cell wall anchor domain-containing protein [Lachnospiraceae bacterium]|nr:LPXTG cell wall anchor domain-containing protein [Lachnospiraceae bacterium]
MKKRLAAVIMALAVTFGMRIPAFAYCSMTYPVSASDLSGPVATPGFDFEASLDFDMLNKFWDVSTDQQQELKAYYGYDDLASSPYANGTLHLSGTSASESNPVTVTFSLSATEEWNLPMAEERIYVMQQFSDGSCKIIPAEFISRTAVSASFTDAVDSKILIISLDLGREGLIYDYVEDAKDISGVQSAVDKDNNPVTVTVSPLDWDRKAIAGEKAGFPYGEDVLTFADVNLEGATASEANPITVTFLVEGVKAGHDISVIHKKADGTWETLTGTAGDGTVTATFTSFSPIAIVNNSLKQTRPSNTGNSGNTGNTDNSGNTGSTSNSGNTGNNSSTGNTGNTGNTNNNGNTNSTGSSASSGNTNTSNIASAASTSALPKTGDEGAFSFVILAIASASACVAVVYSIQRKRNFFTKR